MPTPHQSHFTYLTFYILWTFPVYFQRKIMHFRDYTNVRVRSTFIVNTIFSLLS